MPLLVWHSSHTNLGPKENVLFCIAKNVTCQCEGLWAGVEGPCLYRPENWLEMQLIDEPKLVYKVGFIREKGKATARACSRAQKPVAHCSGEDWGFYGHFNSGFG
jgi:hypothetical protein